ncbi:MAG: hypothetical protein ACR2OH_11850 [Microthrixaceae bacterium]
MAENNDETHSGAPIPTAEALGGSRSPRRGRVGSSVGVVISGMEPAGAARLAADVQDLLPNATRQEFLVLDDHTSPSRRDLVSALDGVGDAMRLVPRPSGGRAVEYDALAVSCGSEFLLFAIGSEPPLSAVEPLMELMWSRGSDAGVVLADGVPDPADVGAAFTNYLSLGAPAVDEPGARVVVVRRWVSRWVFSETERALDAAEEVADRARLLGLDMVVVDAAGELIS